MKAAFFASDYIAVGAMDFLLKKSSLACVVSNPDRPKGRGKKLSPNAAAEWALSNGVEMMRPEKSPGSDVLKRFSELGVDCVVVMAYGKFLKDEILNFPKLGCLNLHASLLPHLRGASPVETAIAIGDNETGVSLMRITSEMDAGPVADSLSEKIFPDDTSKTLREKLRLLSAKLLEKNFAAIQNKTLHFTEQDSSKADYCRKLSKEDMAIDFRLPAKEIADCVRAFGGGIFKVGEATLKAGEVAAEKSTDFGEPGMVAEADPKRGLKILCGGGSALEIKTLQRPCMKMMPAREVLKSFSIAEGSIIKSFERIRPLIKK